MSGLFFPKGEPIAKRCCRCREWLPASAFSPNRTSSDGLQSACTPCQRAYVREHYYANRGYYLAKAAISNKKRNAWLRGQLHELKAVRCSDCGVQYPPWVMEFDHVRGEKLFNVSAPPTLDRDSLMAEAAKCEIVCANCHRQRTRQRATRP